MKISFIWVIVAVAVTIAAFYLYMEHIYVPDKTVTVQERPTQDVVTLVLPNSASPAVFGPKYWEAFHTLADRIPCGECRDKGSAFVRFFHDLVNRKLGKPIYDQANFDFWMDFLKKPAA